MPRQARLDIPGALHHIMVRGINKSTIFADDQDKSRFLDRLGYYVMNGKCSVYAWVLMDTHIHVLFKSGEQGISCVMRKLLTWYAQYFNRRHGRSGHLFENRYKSILCDEDSYLLALVRYIHLNPVRAGLMTTVEELGKYSWSGHSTLMGQASYEWMATEYVLRQFGVQMDEARNAYHQFVSEGVAMGKVPELSGGGLIKSKGGWSQVVAARRRGDRLERDERILGDNDFVAEILKETEERAKSQFKVRQAGRTLVSIIEEECARENISIQELRGGSRRNKVSAVRSKIARRGVEELGVTLAEIARHVGVNTSSVAKAIVRASETQKSR